MKTYKNIDERWGDAVDATADDYRHQAGLYGCDADDIEERADGIYVRGALVAEAVL